MNSVNAAIKTKIADELATALLAEARGRFATAQAETAEDRGDSIKAAHHENAMLSSNSYANEARRRVELIIETAQTCGVHVGDAFRISAETEALEQSAGGGKTIREAVADFDAQTRAVRRS